VLAWQVRGHAGLLVLMALSGQPVLLDRRGLLGHLVAMRK
jgi:hypothetical protein